MELFITPQWAPNIHPLLVHFPIAILVVAALANLATLFIPSAWWDETKNTILYVAGAIFAGITYYSGTIAADTVFLPTEAQSVLSEHAEWARYLLWFFVLYALLRMAFHWFDLFERKSFKIIAFITVLPGLFMIFETAEYGGKMVYGYGAGTGQLLQQEEPETFASPDSLNAVSSFHKKENGDWNWSVSSNAVSDLITNFKWEEGTVQDLKPVVVSAESPKLKIELSDQTNMFVTREEYRDVQIDYYLNLDNLDGEVELIHHVQDTENYDFVSLNDEGIIRQGRVDNGETAIFEEGTFEPNGEIFVRVVGDGSHFRGYVNKAMKVHGHGDAPKAGSVGIKLSGEGSVLISEIELSQL